MRIGYYPGCSLQGSSREFDESMRAVAAALDLELVEVPDWACCGASSAHLLEHDLGVALPIRILAQAEAAGLREVLAPCAACYNRLMSAQAALEGDPAHRAAVLAQVGLPYEGRVKVVNVLEVLDRLKAEVTARVVRPFLHRAACYYGCLLVRPPRVLGFDRAEDPQSMDRLVEAAGGLALPWAFKTECCGAAFSVTRTDLVARLSGRVLRDAADRGAEVMVVACPMCHSNLDMRRPEICAELGRDLRMPVLFITQVIGLALGLSDEDLGLHRHMVPVRFPAAEAAQEVR